jgi:hypothetical protein
MFLNEVVEYVWILKKWIEKMSVLSAVYCSCVSLFDVVFENGL